MKGCVRVCVCVCVCVCMCFGYKVDHVFWIGIEKVEKIETQ